MLCGDYGARYRGVEGVVEGVQRAVARVVADVSKNLIELDMGHVPTCAVEKKAL